MTDLSALAEADVLAIVAAAEVQSSVNVDSGMLLAIIRERNEAIGRGERQWAGWVKCCGYTMTIDHPSTWRLSAHADPGPTITTAHTPEPSHD